MDDQPEEDDDRPWEQQGSLRRDALPHRGELLRHLGNIAVGCCLLSGCLVVPSLISFALGIAVWVMAGQDLAKMRTGMMDPQGESETVNARNAAAACVILSIPIAIFYGIPLSGAALVQFAAKIL